MRLEKWRKSKALNLILRVRSSDIWAGLLCVVGIVGWDRASWVNPHNTEETLREAPKLLERLYYMMTFVIDYLSCLQSKQWISKRSASGHRVINKRLSSHVLARNISPFCPLQLLSSEAFAPSLRFFRFSLILFSSSLCFCSSCEQ